MGTANKKSTEKICPKCDGKMISIWTGDYIYREIGHECGECGYKEMLDPLDQIKMVITDTKITCPSCGSNSVTIHPPEMFCMFGEKNSYGICQNCGRSCGIDEHKNLIKRLWQT